MCNKGIDCLSESENPIDQHHHHQAAYLMDSPSATPHFGSNSTAASSPHSNDEIPRVKFLCSFSGNILPRPQDGKLRYVGGETRIVSVPRDIKYDELIKKMRELYEGAAVLKYQQPDEDLDALVSVVNDDDVTNMMEEYDKLGSGDGFTRLRIFLFSYPDQDGSSHYEGDERDNERRYVDALNNLNDGSDFRKQQHPESPLINPVDDMHIAEQFFSPMSLEGGIHSQRGDISVGHYNLHQLKIPHIGSGQHHQPMSQRYNEMEAPWSPAYYSPRQHGHPDSRPMAEFPTSPSSARYRMPFSDFPDKCLDRMPEDYVRQPLNHQPAYEHQHQYSENVVWLPPSGAITGEKSGFPGNIFHGTNVVEGNSICEHCRMGFQRNQPHFEQPNMVNGFHQVANPSADCSPNREAFNLMNPDAKLHHEIYTSEQNNGLPSLYNDHQNHERGWIPHHHLNGRTEEARPHVSGAGKLSDHYVVEGPSMSLPLGPNNMVDGHHVCSNYVHQRPGPEIANEVFHDRAVAAPPHAHVAPPEERGVRYGNLPYAYGGDNLYPVSHGHAPGHAVWRNVQSPMHPAAPYESSLSAPQVNGSVNSGYLRHEGSPRFCVPVDSQNPWFDSSQKMFGVDGKAVPDYSYGHSLKLNTLGQENHEVFPQDPVQNTPGMLNCAVPLDPVTEVVGFEEKRSPREGKEVNLVDKVENFEMQVKKQINLSDKNSELESLESMSLPKLADESENVVKTSEKDRSPPEFSKLSVNNLSFIPELIASAKRAALEGAEEVKANVEESNDLEKTSSIAKEAAAKKLEEVNTPGDGELNSENDNVDNSKIEPTKAEAEAISKGLQTINNDDLEEIRELGSGTYGAVYHGKWRGSDVAIKRIKSSCFAGRPSERERLIADFWKEALILSSLHHPNVVSFYGIVRDGPDGSLATVTEFMVNGSLKQFLQKKDRTIDRRKRLIIAMDAAFGMEYLHGKNIVHFDLKCENLLVNMRDPQRPVCKIGDLGLSKVKQHTLVSGGVRGTLPWMAPELLSGKSNMVTEKIDVYSFGIVMWELLTGEEPYTDMHCASIIGGIVNNTLRPQIPTWCDPEWKSLMESSWASEPAQRPSFTEISQKLRSMAGAMNVK